VQQYPTVISIAEEVLKENGEYWWWSSFSGRNGNGRSGGTAKISDVGVETEAARAAREEQERKQSRLDSLNAFADTCEFDLCWKAIAKCCYASEEFAQRYMVETLQLFRPIGKVLNKCGSVEIQNPNRNGSGGPLAKGEKEQLKLIASVIVVNENLFKKELYPNTVQRAKDFLKANGISITSDGLQLTEETGVRKNTGSF